MTAHATATVTVIAISPLRLLLLTETRAAVPAPALALPTGLVTEVCTNVSVAEKIGTVVEVRSPIVIESATVVPAEASVPELEPLHAILAVRNVIATLSAL